MGLVHRSLNAHHVNRRGPEIVGLILLAAVLQAGAAVGMAYVAGFSDIRATLDRVQWPWLIALVVACGVSFVGYYYAYHGIYRVEHGKTLDRTQMRAVVTAGFGGFLAHGGTALDNYAMRAAGAAERDAKVRVSALAGLEHGVLSVGCSIAAIYVLAAGLTKPPLDFAVPWAVIPLPGFFVAFWLAERYRDRLRDREGWRGKLAVFLDSIHLVRELFRRPFDYASAPVAMAVFWAADIFAVWAAFAAFGYEMNVAALAVGFGTGLVFTRRTGPLGGAGVLMVILPMTLWYSGAPLAVAVVGVFAYRVLTLWLPLPFSLASLPRLREIGKAGVPHAEGTARAKGEPALQRQASE
jgi:uncharacterized membrane protein YbhN (UPF0104 family)